ncbi:putative up-regulator of cell proliferation-like [Apostichopus japonicus]|uniref:Putative up-regulator of cell proliferation-like n=1 Tax=Stichopus japonicus TaxID=307972 RepID=A0A2G8JIT8_STIJA|nr:putative up-regulator of cell proliferation-like [Apostichopus japonicus]
MDPGDDHQMTFGQFKISLANQLTQQNCDNLCVYFEFNRSTTDKIVTSNGPQRELLNVLTEKQKILKDDVTELEKALRELEEYKVADFVLAYQQSFEHVDIFPEDVLTDEESGEDEAHGKESCSFDTLLEIIGLKDRFPGNLTLAKLCYVTDPDLANDEAILPDLFWQKLGALDYRARSSDFLTSCMKDLTPKISVRDFIFAFIHCADSFLRQDVLEKMSACQLAVPIILQGVKGIKSTFLTWSLRRIVKEWKRVNFTAMEHHIVTVPIFSVSFLRIGEIKDFSKSKVINYLLGPLQGHHKFSYFLSREDETCSSRFSDGCVEGVWYLPTNSNGSEKLKWIISILNLRGDATGFTAATKFICKSANLTFAFLAKRNQGSLSSYSRQVKSFSNKLKFIVIDDECKMPPKMRKWEKWHENFLYVRFFSMKSLCAEICVTISVHCKKCPPEHLKRMESLDQYCENIDVEDENEGFRKSQSEVKELCDFGGIDNLAKFKEKAFPLQSMWVDWVNIDKEPIKPDGDSEKSVDVLLDEIKSKKQEKRKQQLECGLSETMKIFQKTITNTENDMERFGYFVSYLQERLRRREDENIRENLEKMMKLEKRIEELDKRIKDKINTAHEDGNEPNDDGQEQELRKERQTSETLRLKEAQEIRDKSLGWEHFFRELGQWYEAHNELEDTLADGKTNVFFLPTDASRLLLHGHAVEIMDGDTGRVPLSWVSSVLNELANSLGDPPILVVCAVGVQSSGKSTLLNTMFGVQFPVRSGQCTRGLFLRVLKVHDDYEEKLGVKYIFLIDSEGIGSQERISKDDFRFDNELVTLVLCISDVALLNIAGENVGPEMTGLLQIAAHALIRMKKVELHSQCRIVQQRVSKVTAEKRNKVSMTQIESTLNKAIKDVSVKEGFGNRYENFSDIFDLRRGIGEENLQYLPPLWTTSMSPPQEMYGYVVTSIKNSILKDVVSEKVKPQFSVSTFRQRIRDVWIAVKDEKFLFNFQDSIKAMDFDNLCMEVNVLINSMKLELIQTLSRWQRRITDSSDEPDELLIIIKKELDEELRLKEKGLRSAFQVYASEHVRKDFILTHSEWMERQVELAITQEKSHVMAVLKNDVATKKLQNDIPDLVIRIRVKLRKHAKDTATRLRGKSDKCDPEKLFLSNWNTWIKESENNFTLSVMSEKALEATCEKVLISITTDMALSSGIKELIKEGGIRTHSASKQWTDYYPEKGEVGFVDQWFLHNTDAIEDIIEECLCDMKERNSEQKFDANILHYVLRDALQKLSHRFSSEPYYLLKAKVMLYICGKLFDIVLESQRMYERDHSFLALMENEKRSIRNDFLAFFKSDDLVHRVIHVFQNLLNPVGLAFIHEQIKNKIIFAIVQSLPRNRSVKMFTLREMSKKDNFLEYILYTKDPMKFFSSVVEMYITYICCQTTGVDLIMKLHAHEALEILVNTILTAIKDANKAAQLKKHQQTDSSLFKYWVESFMQLLNANGIPVRPESSQEPNSFVIHDLDMFVKDFTKFVMSDFKNVIMQQLKLPDSPNQIQVSAFLKKHHHVDSILAFVLSTYCFEQCPMCGASCENPLPIGATHGDHFTTTHLPRGLSGTKYRKSQNLETADCQASVGSSIDTYTLNGQKKMCKDYKQDFPSWVIKPKGELLPTHHDYWKWVMKTHNINIAKYYNCQPAKIPPRWKRITKEHVLQCLRHDLTISSIQFPAIPAGVPLEVSLT